MTELDYLRLLRTTAVDDFTLGAFADWLEERGDERSKVVRSARVVEEKTASRSTKQSEDAEWQVVSWRLHYRVFFDGIVPNYFLFMHNNGKTERLLDYYTDEDVSYNSLDERAWRPQGAQFDAEDDPAGPG